MITQPTGCGLVFHHLAVQTADFGCTVAWYQEFFGCTLSWTLKEFSELTKSRLPGINELAELTVGSTRFHIFTRKAGLDRPPPRDTLQYQHVCMSVDSPDELLTWRQRWLDIYGSGRYAFTIDSSATEVDIDAAGVQSFYCYDPNGLEYEFTHDPAGAQWHKATS